MSKKILGMFLVLGFLLFWACSKDSTPATPPTPQIPSCERNNTSEIAFKNNSTSNTTYDVIWDGVKKTTLAPGTKSQTYTEAAGTHTCVFLITNTKWYACNPGSPVLIQCDSQTLACSN